jgi:hypothetical protein
MGEPIYDNTHLEVLNLFNKLTRSPTVSEIYQFTNITENKLRASGGYRRVLKALGLKEPTVAEQTNREDTLTMLKEFISNQKRIPSKFQLVKLRLITFTLLESFGKYEDLLVEMGFKPYESYTDEDFIEICKKEFTRFENVDVDVIRNLYNDGILPFGGGVIQRKFGGLSKLLLLCGFPYKVKVRRHDHYSKEQMRDAFLEFYTDKNIPPTQLEVFKDYSDNKILFNAEHFSRDWGSYSKFLIENGYTHNKGKYSQKYISSDGTVCDSKKELLIDEFLNSNKIPHKHHVKYSDLIDDIKKWHKMDFLLSDGTIVEYFGLQGVKKYDEKIKKKLAILEENNMKYIAIYPKDISKLPEIFSKYLKEVN